MQHMFWPNWRNDSWWCRLKVIFISGWGYLVWDNVVDKVLGQTSNCWTHVSETLDSIVLQIHVFMFRINIP